LHDGAEAGAIVDALAARDPAAARPAMTAHIQARLAGVLHELDSAADGKPRH
jgi:DNA-binding GntR family transcriptional regulator